MARVTLKPSEMSYPYPTWEDYVRLQEEADKELFNTGDSSLTHLTVKALVLIGQELNGIRIRMK